MPNHTRLVSPRLASIFAGVVASAVALVAGVSMRRTWEELSEMQPQMDSDEEQQWRAVLSHERRFQFALSLGFAHEGDDAEPPLS